MGADGKKKKKKKPLHGVEPREITGGFFLPMGSCFRAHPFSDLDYWSVKFDFVFIFISHYVLALELTDFRILLSVIGL